MFKKLDYVYNEFQLEYFMVDFLRKSLDSDEPDKEIVFVGDSIIRDYDLNRFFPKIKEKLLNCGVSGITSEGLLNIIQHGVIRHKPKTIVILVGTNDMSPYHDKRDEEIILNISRMISELKFVLDKVNIVLISILPCDEKRYGKEVIGGGRENSRIKIINDKLGKFKQIYKDFIFVDVFDKLCDEKRNIINEYTHDGIHLTVKGYQLVTDILTPILNKFINLDSKGEKNK